MARLNVFEGAAFLVCMYVVGDMIARDLCQNTLYGALFRTESYNFHSLFLKALRFSPPQNTPAPEERSNTMATFRLPDVISDNASTAAAFNRQLYDKLGSKSGDKTFDTVRCLFRESASALQRTVEACDVLAHWIPGRIEVMGKHTVSTIAGPFPYLRYLILTLYLGLCWWKFFSL